MNTQGLRNRFKRYDVLKYLKDLNANIISLQDTHLTDKDLQTILDEWEGEIILHGNKTNSRGVALLFSKNFEYSVLNIVKDNIGNLLMADIDLKDFTIKLFSIYGPNEDNPTFYNELEAMIQTTPQDYTIISGDFNITLDQNMDTYNYTNVNNPQAKNTVLQLMELNELVDTFRHLNPNTRRFTLR